LQRSILQAARIDLLGHGLFAGFRVDDYSGFAHLISSTLCGGL
jgi:hypothetical protein